MVSRHNLSDYEAEREQFSWDDIYAEADWDAPGRSTSHTRLRTGTLLTVRRSRSIRSTLTATHEDDVLGAGRPLEPVRERPRGPWVSSRATACSRTCHGFRNTTWRWSGRSSGGAVWGSVNERFGPDGISYRLDDCEANVVVTTTDNRDTVEDALDDAPSVEHVITVDRGGGAPTDDVVFNTALDGASTAYDAAETGGEDDALLYYTSGGRPAWRKASFTNSAGWPALPRPEVRRRPPAR